jgi:hypothetical protein
VFTGANQGSWWGWRLGYPGGGFGFSYGGFGVS